VLGYTYNAVPNLMKKVGVLLLQCRAKKKVSGSPEDSEEVQCTISTFKPIESYLYNHFSIIPSHSFNLVSR